MTKGANDNSVYRVGNAASDGSNLDLPDTDASGETDPDGDALTNNGGEGYDVRGEDSVTVKVVNGWDVNADITLKGTTFDDAGMGEDADDQTAITVNAGTNDFLSTTEGWDYVRVLVSPAADPTAGTLKVVFQSDKTGG